MTLADMVFTAIMFASGWIIGTVFPLWQPEKESEEPEVDDINGR